MEIYAGYHSLNKKGRPNEDRYRLLGGGWVMPDDRCTAFADTNRGQIYGVMDGVGSAPKGMQAAQHVADKLIDFYTNQELPTNHISIHGILQEANIDIFSWGLISGSDRPQGACAATVVWFSPDRKVFLFHAGDTRAFQQSASGIRILTTEHGTDAGISRYMDQGEGLKLEIKAVPFKEEEVLCLVSDGITKVLHNGEIETILKEEAGFGSPDVAARNLFERAHRKGVQDDITAVVVELEEW